MPAPNPLQELVADSHPLGMEVDLEWQLPPNLPSTFDVYIFRKQGSDITQSEIDSYFNNPNSSQLAVTTLKGDPEFGSPLGVKDFTVTDGQLYYYRVVIYNSNASPTYSSSLGVSITPAKSVVPDVPATIQPIIDVIKRVMTMNGMKEKKDYEIHKQYSLEKNITPVFYVMRAGANVMQRFIGRAISPSNLTGTAGEYGEIEIDNIQVIWEDPSPDRRELIVKIFREAKEAMQRYLVNEQGANFTYVDIIIEGDVYNESVKDRLQIGGSMLIQCGITIKAKYLESLDSWYGLQVDVKN